MSSWARKTDQSCRTAAPNAHGEPRPIGGATQEQRLWGVGSTAMLGPVPTLGS